MKTEVYVMTHKHCGLPDIPGYIRMQVGSALHEDLGYLRDDTGEDHISDLNPYYAELTGMYWLWRNLPEVDNIGICHYRRYFINADKKIMTMPEFEALLEDADVVAALADNDREVLANFALSHRVEDLIAVGEAIKRLYPEDYPSFLEMLEQKRCTFGNLCVMKREVYADYCQWLFTVLVEAGDYVPAASYDDYHKKVLAIISEGLLWAYIRARGLQMKECKAALFSEKAETTELKKALWQLTKEARFAEAVELYYGVLKLRPDLSATASDLDGELAEMIRVLELLVKEEESGERILYKESNDLHELVKLCRDRKLTM